MKHISILLAIVALVTFSSCGPRQIHTRLMSYNVHNCVGLDGELSVERIARVINEADVEAVAIQELDSMTTRYPGHDMLSEVAALTGMYPTYAPTIDYRGGKYGVGMLTREKPISHRQVPLPCRSEPRTLLIVELENYYYCCTHLSLHEEDRVTSVAIIIEELSKLDKPAIIAGDLYPATAIGINLPNSNWIRSVHGSKSVTIGNFTDAYNKAAHGNGFSDEFVYSEIEKEYLEKYGDLTGDLHTDLHECLGHGSGQLLPGVDPDALKAYGSTIEEARADLFGLYYLPDAKMRELGLTPHDDAYKAEYYSFMMNGLMTQLVRIELGNNVEEAHMRNRQLIAKWVFEKGAADQVVELVKKDGKTYVKVNDYEKLRNLFGQLLSEIQRIKSEGDFEAARQLVENYAVKVDPELHKEVLARYEKLNLAPYKGFVNPVYVAETDAEGNITDVKISYGEGYAEQMLRYSKDYANLPYINE